MNPVDMDIVNAVTVGGPDRVWPGMDGEGDVVGGWGESSLDESGVLTVRFTPFDEHGPAEARVIRFVEMGKLLDALVRSDLTGLDRDILRGVLQEALDAPAL